MMRPPCWYLALVAAEGWQRLRELRLSRRHETGMVQAPQAAPSTYPWMVALHVALFLTPPLEIALLRRRSHVPALWVGLLGGAVALRWWSIATLGRRWNVHAAVPRDLQPESGGPYRYIRHPNYLAVIVEFLALPMSGGAWLSALGLSLGNGLALTSRIREEERLLARVPGYDRAFRGRARFIPGIF
jgi:methyltransferase